MGNFQQEWGRLLREARIKAGYRQTGLAAAARVSQQAISKWEQGLAVPPDYARVRLASILGVPIYELFPYELIQVEA